jgi:serine/threonine protein kinase
MDCRRFLLSGVNKDVEDHPNCRGSLSEREAASVLKVVLQVIQHCHSNGVLHRDIKPENFMMKVGQTCQDALSHN